MKPVDHSGRAAKRGQAMIESLLVMLLASLVFFAVFQYAHLFACKTILSHAATRAARARSVGFNEWMVRKSALVAAIPASGRRLSPAYSDMNGAYVAAIARRDPGTAFNFALRASFRSQGQAMEVGRIPEFMESINSPTAETILDYEYWDRTDVDIRESPAFDGSAPGTLTVRVRQRHPLLIGMNELEEGEIRSVNEHLEAGEAPDESLSIAGEYSIESHYPLYLEDAQW